MTILFEEDWAKFNARPHLTTKNESAIRLAKLLRHMGVKNHQFFLALHNPDLEFVDPHDENLSYEVQAAVLKEVRENFWYYIREYVKPPGHSGSNKTIRKRFLFNRANIALYFYYWNHVRIYLELIRQAGKSFPSDCLAAYLINFRCQNTNVALYTKDSKLQAETTARIRKIMDEFPAWSDFRRPSDSKNQEMITVNALRNKYLTDIAKPSVKDADNIFRGFSITTMHGDEGPFLKNIHISLPAILAASTAAIEDARLTDEPHGFLFTSSAGVLDTEEGRYYYRLISEACPHSEYLYDCTNRAELVEVVEKRMRMVDNETGRILSPKGAAAVYAPFNHRQIGRTDDWLLQTLNQNSASGAAANKDYFGIWQSSGGSENPLSAECRAEMIGSVRDSLWLDVDKDSKLSIDWVYPREVTLNILSMHDVIVGADTSEASGGDDIGITFVSAKTGETLGTAVLNETNIHVFGTWFGTLFERFPRLTAIIERKSTGMALIDYLLYYLPSIGIDPVYRLWNRIIDDLTQDPDKFKPILAERRTPDFYVRYKKYFGFTTSAGGKTDRSELYSTYLQEAAKRSADRIHSKTLVNQINGLIKKNGYVNHASGQHDDLVISWLLCHRMLIGGFNLKYYGIETSDIYSNCRDPFKPFGAETKSAAHESNHKRTQDELVRIANDIKNRMSNERSALVLTKLKQSLDRVTAQIDSSNIIHATMDEFMTHLQQKRRGDASTREKLLRSFANNNTPTPNKGNVGIEALRTLMTRYVNK